MASTNYTAVIADPTALAASLTTRAGAPHTGTGPAFFDRAAFPGLDRIDYDLSNLSIRETLRGQACVIEVTLRTKQARLLVADGGKWLFIWTDYSCPAGKGRVLGLGKIEALPSSIGSQIGKTVIEAWCRKSDWQRTTHNVMKAAVVYDRGFYDAESGPSTGDLMACSALVPVIDRRSLAVFTREHYARIDVDSSRPPGNVSVGGVTAYDATPYAQGPGFDIRRSQANAVINITTKFQVPWTQYWAGPCDLAPSVSLGMFNTVNGSGGGFFTYTPDEFKGSFPQVGASIGTGWTVQRSKLICVDYTDRFFRSTGEAAVAAAMADGFDPYSTSGNNNDSDGRGAVDVPYASIRLAPGANISIVAWGEYTQQRRETVNVTTTLLLDPIITGTLAPATGAKVALADPTTPVTGTAWLPETPYNQDEVAWFGGRRRTSLDFQISGANFNPLLWATDVDPPGEPTNAGAYVWSPNTYYTAGTPIHPSATDNRFFYRNKTGNSGGTTWAADATQWTEGPSPVNVMSQLSPVYIATDRGKMSIAHLDQRHYAMMLANAKILEAVFRMRFDDVLDPGTDLRAMDLSVGMCLRVRTNALTSGIVEVIGVIREFAHTMAPQGGGDISIVLDIIPGTGLNDAAGTAVAGVMAGEYVNPEPRQPIIVSALWDSGYSCLEASRTGMTFTAQGVAIKAAVEGTSGGFTGAVSAAIGPNGGNRARLRMRDLVQEGLIPLQYPTMRMKPKVAPRNIEFAA